MGAHLVTVSAFLAFGSKVDIGDCYYLPSNELLSKSPHLPLAINAGSLRGQPPADTEANSSSRGTDVNRQPAGSFHRLDYLSCSTLAE